MPWAKRACALVLVFLGISGIGWARTAPSESRLVVFPFEINADQELSYLEESLPAMLGDKLQELGFSVQSAKATSELIREQQTEYLDLQTVRELTILSRGQYGIYGSFTQIGESISLDVRLVEAFGTRESKSLFITRRGLIHLLPAIDELAQAIGKEVAQEETIVEVQVRGTDILQKDVVLMRIRTQEGDLYDPRELNADIRRVFELGYFDDVLVEVEEVAGGKRVTFEVKEKPWIQAISVSGAEAVKERDILAAMNTKTGAVLNLKVLSDDLETIRQLFRKKAFYNATVDYNLEQTDPRRARLNIVVQEGNKLYIRDIRIIGAEQLKESELKKELALSERGFFSRITGSGVLREEMLDRDAAALEAYYGNRGFVDARVGQPQVSYEEEGIVITFRVSEGARYRVGEVSFAGDLLESPERLSEIVRMDDLGQKSEYFDRSVLRQDSQRLADYYTNFGYAFAEADISLDKDEGNRVINVTYLLNKRDKVYIRRVLVEGNTKTRDNVIRREMRLGDGELFSGYRLARSNQRLIRLDFFESVSIETIPADTPAEMDLVVRVVEKPTGMLSLAAGYSTLENFFVSGQIQERNLFGKGYNLSLKTTFGGKTTSYVTSFWNPQVYDSNIGAGIDLYMLQQEFDDYDKDSFGGALKFAYPLGEYTRLFWRYRLEEYTLKNIVEGASDRILDFEGDNMASALYAAVTRDTTNRIFNPTRGTVNTLSAEYAGGVLGGDDNFVKYRVDSSIYHPLFWKTVFHWHGQVGLIHRNAGERIPPFERFYLGGMHSVRGYEARAISPVDETGEKFGGDRAFFTNFELLFPLSEELGIVGLLFFDAGNTWAGAQDVDLDLFKSVGVGIRWYSPLGPLRFEYGYPLDELDGRRKGRFEFSVGTFF
jgi:outer membrane protein insertion porin family